MLNKNQKILVSNNFIAISSAPAEKKTQDISMVATVLRNMAYYGYVPSMEAVDALKVLNKVELIDFWLDTEKAMKELTGADKNMGDFVVYKNFPKEVLDKNQAEYWFAQILMYWGFPNEIFTQGEGKREPIFEKVKLKVLALAPVDVLTKIFNSLKNNTSRWTDMQTEHAKYLLGSLKIKSLNVDEFAFKENGIILAKEMINSVIGIKLPETALSKALKDKGLKTFNSGIKDNVDISMSNATDVLRLVAALSDGDVSLREKVKFKKFKRSERRFLLELLENSNNLIGDCTLRPEMFKKLFAALHPGDYKFGKVIQAYDIIYRDDFVTFNGRVDSHIKEKNTEALTMLESRPGEFVRKLHHMYKLYGMVAIDSFVKVVGKLKIAQLLKLDSYLVTINNRSQLIYPPKGNWSKAKFENNEKQKFSAEDLSSLRSAISNELAMRLNQKFPQGVDLDLNVDNIKLQTNDQKLAPYGRGTVFSIPKNMSFIRTASYWAHKAGTSNNWFDNGWNFYDANWGVKFTCCWNSTDTHSKGAVFSGDPTNSKDLDGRACQMIDLDLDKLKAEGVRYAVWNILCFSNIKFEDAKEVMGTLQWGEEAQSGKLFEPSRAQMVFPIKGKSLTKYIAYLDVVERKIVYMDANFAGSVMSAHQNGVSLQKKMPAFVEYLKSLPSVADLFSHAKKGSMPILLSDEGKKIVDDSHAYVFNPMNPENKFKKVDLTDILS